MNKILIYSAVVAVILILVLGFVYDKPPTKLERSDDFLILKKDAWQGPCPSRDDDACKETIELWSSGRLVYNRKISTISAESVAKIITTMQETGIMKKDCAAPDITDYSASYHFNDGRSERDVAFPGCEKELKTIDETLAVFSH